MSIQEINETFDVSAEEIKAVLPALRAILEAANRRHLEFLSTIEDPRNGRDKLDKRSQLVQNEGRSYPGLNFSTLTTKSYSAPSLEADSTSAACRTRHYADPGC